MRAVWMILFSAAAMSFLSGCALFGKKKKAPYHSSAYHDKNKAPDWMSPPKDMSKGGSDAMAMQAKADFHFTLGETYSLAGDSGKSVEEFRMALVYDPQSPSIRTRLAQEYMMMGLLNEAVEQGELAVQIDGKGIGSRLILGKLYTRLKLYEKALEQYKTVIEIDPKAYDAALFVGAILAEMGRDEEAVDYFTDLADQKDFERKHLAYYYIGKIEQQSLKEEALRRAERAYRKSLKEDPKFEDSVIALSRLHIHREDKKEAIRFLSEFQVKHGPTEKVADLLVTLFMDGERFDEAFEQFEVLEDKNPNDLNIKMKMALILMDKKKFQKAIGYLKSILAREPSLDKVRFYLAAVYEELKRYPEAIAHFEKVPPSSHYYADSVIHASYLYKLQGGVDKAIASVRDGIKKRSDVSEFYTLYASLLDETEKYQKAIDMLDGALERFPNNTQLLFYQGSMYDKVGNFKKTVENMKKVLDLDKNHVQALNYLAYTYADRGIELVEAEKLVRRALRLTPDDGYIMDTLGWVLFKKGELKESVLVLEKAYALKNTESIIAEHLGDAYYSYELPEKARRMYRKAAQIEKDLNKLEQIQNKIKAIDSQKRFPASAPE